MVGMLGAIGGGALGGASVNIVIRAVDKFSKTFGIANVGLLKLGAGITAVGVAGAFAIGGITKLAGNLEQAEIAFKTMLGSAEKADKLLRDLSDFAAKTPFTIPGIRQNAKQLLAMGVELDDMLPTLKALGDVSAGLSVPLERLALNFGQVKVQGRLTGRELRDFSIAGVPLLAELATNLNLTETEIKDMVSAGKIGFADVEKAFQTMSGEGGKFFNLMEEQNKSLFGQISNIQDSFTKLGEVMGNEFLPIVKKGAEAIRRFAEALEKQPELARFVALLLGIATAGALIIGPILMFIALMPFVEAGLVGATAAAGLWLLVAAGVVLAIAGLIAIFKMAKDGQIEFTVGIHSILTELQSFWVRIWGSIANFFITIWNTIVQVAEDKINSIIDGINLLIKGIEAASLGLIKVGEVSSVSFSKFKGELVDIEAILGNIANQHAEIVNNALLTKMSQQTTEELTKQADKNQELVDQLQGMKVLFSRDPTTGKTTFGDVFNPGAMLQDDFTTPGAFQQAIAGAGITINIENINGIDPEEIAAALSNELNSKISI